MLLFDWCATLSSDCSLKGGKGGRQTRKASSKLLALSQLRIPVCDGHVAHG